MNITKLLNQTRGRRIESWGNMNPLVIQRRRGQRLWVATIVAILVTIWAVTAILAAPTVNSVFATPNPVAPGGTLEVTVNATTGAGSGDRWLGTEYSFDGINWTCVDTPNITTNTTSASATFNITSVPLASYTLRVKVDSSSTCIGNESSIITRSITVGSPILSATASSSPVALNGTVTINMTVNCADPTNATTCTDWRGVRYSVDGTTWYCVNTTNHDSNDGPWSESFLITMGSPLLTTTGTYSLQIQATTDDSCLVPSGSSKSTSIIVLTTVTPVVLTGLQASPNEAGINVTWQTATETDFAGFYVWHASGADGDFQRISPLIVAKGGPVSGASYEYLDNRTLSGLQSYRLEAVDLDNSSEFFDAIVQAQSSTPTGSIKLFLPMTVR